MEVGATATLQRVAQGLRPLEAVLTPAPGSIAPGLTGDEREYLNFYGIDFSAHFPQLEQLLGYVESGEFRLAVHVLRYAAPRGVLLLVHGYTDHVGLFGHLIRYGLERGYTVVAFDLPGHGLSSGERASIDDFSDYRLAIDEVVSACGSLSGVWRVIAQSTGAGAALDYLLHRRGGIDKVVMLAPLVRPKGWYWVLPAYTLLHRFRDGVKRNFAENSNDRAFLDWIQSDPLQPQSLSLRWIGALRRWIKVLPKDPADCDTPVLIIQGDADETVDWRYNIKRIQRVIPHARVEYLAGGRHHLANESQALRDRIYALVDEFFA